MVDGESQVSPCLREKIHIRQGRRLDTTVSVNTWLFNGCVAIQK